MGQKNSKSKATARTHEAGESAAEWVSVDQLKPWAQNPRKNAAAIPKVVESIKRFGFAAPIVARKADGEIIAGHTRYAAAQALGMTKVPVRYVDLDPSEARLLALADNRLNEFAEWDKPALQEIMSGYGLEAIDVAGWDSKDIDLMGHELLRDSEVLDSEAPSEAPQPRAKLGDVWQCGRHVIVCGSSEDHVSWSHCPGGERMVVTDPPYGVEYDAAWRNSMGLGAIAVGAVLNDDRADWSNVFALAAGDVVYSWCASTQIATILGHMAEYDFRALLIWNKSRHAISRGHYHHKHEPCLYFVRKGATAKWCGDRSQVTVWDIPAGAIDNAHSTSKPIECMARPIRNHSYELIVDPFLGSGTTVLAAEQLGRTCFGIELAPEYVDISIARWEKLTGKTATLAQ